MTELVYFVQRGFNKGVSDAMTLRPLRDVVHHAVSLASKKSATESRSKKVRDVREVRRGEHTKKAG